MSQRSRLSAGFQLASTLTLALSVASYQGMRTEAQTAQAAAHSQATIANDSTAPTSASTLGAWQSQPVTLPIQASQLGLSRDGQRMIAVTSRSSNAGSGCLEVWNTQTQGRLLSVPANNKQFEAAAISADGSKVAAIVQGQENNLSLWIWTIVSEQPPIRVPLVRVPLVRMSLSSAEPIEDETASSNMRFARLSADIAFSPDTAKLLTQTRYLDNQSAADNAQTLQLHSTTTGESLHTLSTTAGAQIEQFAFSPDGEKLAGVGEASSEASTVPEETHSVVNLWQTSSGQLISSFSPDDAVINEDGLSNTLGYAAAVTFTPTGQLKTLSSFNLALDQLITWDLSIPATSEVQTLLEVDRQDFIHQLSPDGIYHFMRGDVAGTRLLNTQTLEVVQIDNIARKAAFSADGDYLAIATPDSVQIFSKHDR